MDSSLEMSLASTMGPICRYATLEYFIRDHTRLKYASWRSCLFGGVVGRLFLPFAIR